MNNSQLTFLEELKCLKFIDKLIKEFNSNNTPLFSPQIVEGRKRGNNLKK